MAFALSFRPLCVRRWLAAWLALGTVLWPDSGAPHGCTHSGL